MSHYSYGAIVEAAKHSEQHDHGYCYAVVQLLAGDTSENPASTKHKLIGPSVWLWEVHPSGITAREYDEPAAIPASLYDGAAKLGGDMPSPGRAALTDGIVKLRGQGWTEEQIIDEVAKIMAETLPERS